MDAIGLRTPANRVSRAAFWYWTLRESALGCAATVVAFSVGTSFDTGRRLVELVPYLVLAVAVAVALVVPTWRWRVHRWEVTDSAIYTLEGAISRDWRIVPLVRIQTVDVEQNSVERLFGIARLVVKTASYSGSTDVVGLDMAVAHALAAQLTERLRRTEDDGT